MEREDWPVTAMDSENWVVRLHGDYVNTAHSIVYALHRITDVPIEEARRRMTEIEERGTTDVAAFGNHMEAENLVEQFLVFGVAASVVQG
jgi:ATP-dependent Clp protease adapter protein ClpS